MPYFLLCGPESMRGGYEASLVATPSQQCDIVDTHKAFARLYKKTTRLTTKKNGMTLTGELGFSEE